MQWSKPELIRLDIRMTQSGAPGSASEESFVQNNGSRPGNNGKAPGHGGWYDIQMAEHSAVSFS